MTCPPDEPSHPEKTDTVFTRANRYGVQERVNVDVAVHSGTREAAPLIHGEPRTTLTRFLEVETWTPLEAALLGAGVLPDHEYETVPEQAIGLDYRPLPKGHACLREAKRILHIWNSQATVPQKVRPADFVAWCESHQIDTVWLRDVPRNTQPSAVEATPVFSMSRKALVRAHKREWPTIEADLKDASRNELSAAKVGTRGWNEGLALEWARVKGRLVPQDSPAHELQRAMFGETGLRTRKHHGPK